MRILIAIQFPDPNKIGIDITLSSVPQVGGNIQVCICLIKLSFPLIIFPDAPVTTMFSS